jgi:hypothetical protein
MEAIHLERTPLSLANSSRGVGERHLRVRRQQCDQFARGRAMVQIFARRQAHDAAKTPVVPTLDAAIRARTYIFKHINPISGVCVSLGLVTGMPRHARSERGLAPAPTSESAFSSQPRSADSARASPKLRDSRKKSTIDRTPEALNRFDRLETKKRSMKLIGGPGRTRTCDLTVMSGQL